MDRYKSVFVMLPHRGAASEELRTYSCDQVVGLVSTPPLELCGESGSESHAEASKKLAEYSTEICKFIETFDFCKTEIQTSHELVDRYMNDLSRPPNELARGLVAYLARIEVELAKKCKDRYEAERAALTSHINRLIGQVGQS